MALSSSLTTPSGVALSEAYIVVRRINLDNVSKYAEISIRTWADSSTRAALKEPVKDDLILTVSGEQFTKWFSADALDVSNPYKAAYDYIKSTQKEFKSATSV